MTRRQRNSAGGERGPTETENFLRAIELALLGTDEVLWLQWHWFYESRFAARFSRSVKVLESIATRGGNDCNVVVLLRATQGAKRWQ